MKMRMNLLQKTTIEQFQNKIITNFYSLMKKTDESGAVRKKLENYSYLLNQNIGKGYSSQVFRGRNDLSDETVAIKVIDMKMIKGEVHKNLLASEIEVLKILKDSENIIEVYDIYTTKNNTYIITELCQSGDLAKQISSRKQYSEGEAISIMNQILNGYSNMYSRGIIHRDLKPANIFLKGSTVKLADFGFAMKYTDAKKYSSYNVGSPVYMPPEALNENKYSFKSDVWALGVIYYEMLTGKTPWRAKTQKDLAKQLTSISIKKLLPPSISQSSQTFLLKTLAVDINERMTPQEVQRYTLTVDRVNMNKHLYSTENSIFDGRNNNIIKRTEHPLRLLDRHQTSLTTKNSINTPSNAKRMTFLHTNDQFKTHNFSLPKTAASISNKTEHFISTSNQTINNGEPLTQKEINVHQSVKETTGYDKKYLSKQLLSQIHLCRFLYKLIIRINEKLSEEISEELTTLKGYMTGLIFEKLEEVEHLRAVPLKYSQDYKASQDYYKITQIIDQYEVKYSKDLSHLRQINKPLQHFKDHLTKNIISIYQRVDGQDDISEWKEEVIVLDYLVTLRQLIGLLQNNDLEGFHNKSKIQTIVEGSPSKTITHEHLNAIRTKLKAIKII